MPKQEVIWVVQDTKNIALPTEEDAKRAAKFANKYYHKQNRFIVRRAVLDPIKKGKKK